MSEKLAVGFSIENLAATNEAGREVKGVSEFAHLEAGSWRILHKHSWALRIAASFNIILQERSGKAPSFPFFLSKILSDSTHFFSKDTIQTHSTCSKYA